MVSPIYGDPSYKIFEVVGPNTIDIKIQIVDFKRFVERLMGIKDGWSLILQKEDKDTRVRITLFNADFSSAKALGDKR